MVPFALFSSRRDSLFSRINSIGLRKLFPELEELPVRVLLVEEAEALDPVPAGSGVANATVEALFLTEAAAPAAIIEFASRPARKFNPNSAASR